MDTTLKLIGDYGLVAVMLCGFSVLFIKYIPKLMNIWIDRLKSKNSAYDLIMEMQKNNNAIIENNSRVIENNTEAMRKSTEHYDKINEALDRLNENFTTHDLRAEQIAKDTAIIRERKK